MNFKSIALSTLAVLSWSASGFAFTPESELEKYVKTPEPKFKSELVGYCLPSTSGKSDCVENQNLEKVQSLLSKKQSMAIVLEVDSLEWKKGEAWRRMAETCPAIGESNIEKDSVWKHHVTVYIPEQINPEGNGLLSIQMGGNETPWYEFAKNGIDGRFDRVKWMDMANQRQSVIVAVGQVPNQSLCFAGDVFANRNKRFEDGILAFGWNKFFVTGDPTWLPQFPMVKAVVNSLNAAETFLHEDLTLNATAPSKYMATGVSKRGWATWLLPLVDQRVQSIVPASIDISNSGQSIPHHFEVYGNLYPEPKKENLLFKGGSFVIADYLIDDYPKGNLISYLDGGEWSKLEKEIDPFHFRNHPALINTPKYILSSSSDPFYLPDASKFSFPHFKGQKAMLYSEIPCVQAAGPDCPQEDVGFWGHGFSGKTRFQQVNSAYQMFQENLTFPEIRSTVTPDGAILIDLEQHGQLVLKKATLHSKVNPKGRDFRSPILANQLWQHDSIQVTPEIQQGTDLVVAEQPEFEKGAVAYFVVLEYGKQNAKKGDDLSFKISTPVEIAEK